MSPAVDAPRAMIELAAIERARARIAGIAVRTPLLPSRSLSACLGAEVWLKHETLQVTGSFKVRGALNKLLAIPARRRARGVVAASAGNHAQGVAFAAARVAVPALIVMPERTPQIKVDNTQAHGEEIEIVLHGATYDEAFAHARALASERDLTLIHPFDDRRVMAGQGTIGLELIEDLEAAGSALDAVIVPVGGGGLIAGIASALRAVVPHAKVIGVQSEAAPSMALSLARGRRVRRPQEATIAEGIAVAIPGAHTFRCARAAVDRVVTVSEQAIEAAIVELLAGDKAVVEGAGAAGVAALVGPLGRTLRGKTVAVILSGGNIDLNRLHLIVERWLARRHRLVRLRATLDDRPGALVGLLQAIAERKANVVRVIHDRIFGGSRFGEAEVVVTLEVRDHDHIAAIESHLAERGYRVTELDSEPIPPSRRPRAKS